MVMGVHSVLSSTSAATCHGRMRALLGATTREALRAQLSEEFHVACSASKSTAKPNDKLNVPAPDEQVNETATVASPTSSVHETVENTTADLKSMTPNLLTAASPTSSAHETDARMTADSTNMNETATAASPTSSVHETVEDVAADLTNMTPNLPHEMAFAEVSDMTPSFMQNNYGLPLVPYAAGLPRSRSVRLKTSDLKSWMAAEGIPRDGLSDATCETARLLHPTMRARLLRREEIMLR